MPDSQAAFATKIPFTIYHSPFTKIGFLFRFRCAKDSGELTRARRVSKIRLPRAESFKEWTRDERRRLSDQHAGRGALPALRRRHSESLVRTERRRARGRATPPRLRRLHARRAHRAPPLLHALLVRAAHAHTAQRLTRQTPPNNCSKSGLDARVDRNRVARDVLVNDAALHHEDDAPNSRDVFQRVAVERDD